MELQYCKSDPTTFSSPDRAADTGVVWAMDFTGYDLGMASKVYLHNTRDLASRYKILCGDCGPWPEPPGPALPEWKDIVSGFL